jgi:hypothetical protein
VIDEDAEEGEASEHIEPQVASRFCHSDPPRPPQSHPPIPFGIIRPNRRSDAEVDGH